MSGLSSPDKLMESEWLLTLRAGDKGAFTCIYNEYWQQLFTVAYNYTRSREIAQELVQDVFVSLWVKRRELRIHSSLKSYLYGAMRYRLYDMLDKQKSERRFAAYAAYSQPMVEDTTEQQLAFEETTTLIQRQVDAFPATTRHVFLLSRFEGYSVNQIAEKLNLSPKAIEYHITKAIRLLRIHLKDVCLIFLFFEAAPQ